jgi:hypothetical protein
MVFYVQYCCFSGLIPLFSILKRDHHVSGPDSGPVFRWKSRDWD